jgi:hypothetical protein
MQSLLVVGSKVSLLVLLCGWMGCAVDNEAPGEEAPVAALEEEIINGTQSNRNSNFVAIYHRTEGVCERDEGDIARGFTMDYSLPANTWWPRPCSGMVIKKDGDVNYILTARHCVTKQGTPEGDLLTGSTNLRVVGTLNPGVISTNESNGVMQVTGSPPGNSLFASVYYQDYTKYGDLAVVRTTGNLNTLSPPLRPAIMGYTNLSSLIGTDLTTSAYGRYIDGTCYSHQGSGAGRLRSADAITVTAASGTTFRHWATNLSGQTIWHGDSGGPLYTVGTLGGESAYRVYGVHTGPEVASGGAHLVDFVQDAFDYVYLINQETQLNGHVVGVNQVVNGSLLINYSWSDGARVHMKVDRSGGFLQLGDFCVNDEPNGTVRLRACGTANTRWNISVLGVITNRTTGKCLMKNASGNALATQTCGATPQRWAFAADMAMN